MRAGVAFEAQPADIDESLRTGESPEQHALRLAREKALRVARRHAAAPARWVLGADTIVVLGDEVLGKPAGVAEAARMLARLVGRSHRVLTAVALIETGGGAERHALVESVVTLRAATAEELRAYAAGGEPLDKAGAYAAQGEGGRFVSRIEGSRSNVIGLPVDETLALLREAGWRAGP